MMASKPARPEPVPDRAVLPSRYATASVIEMAPVREDQRQAEFVRRGRDLVVADRTARRWARNSRSWEDSSPELACALAPSGFSAQSTATQRMNLARRGIRQECCSVNMTLENRPGREEFPTGLAHIYTEYHQ